jgi:uncharacterized protein YacL
VNIFVRLLGGGLVAAIAIAVTSAAGVPNVDSTSVGDAVLVLGWIGAWFVIGFSVLPYVTVVPARWLIRHVTELSTGDFIAGVAGLIVGLVIGVLLGLPMTNLPDPYNWLLPIGTVLVTGFGMIGLTVAKRADLAEALRSAGLIRTIPDRPEAGEDSGPTTYVDTSALIDGRMTDVVAAGFLYGTLVVPRFVVAELQHIADNRDQTRRVRGRRGLEVLNALQKDHRVAVELSDEDPAGIDAVDAKLVELARRRGAGILTNDYNLNRVAQLDNVRVLNLNQLANALKPAFLPGDALQVKVIQQGREPGQGLAYLDDGTMIVVEGGGTLVDREIEVTVVRVLQTVAGRMVFAQPRG